MNKEYRLGYMGPRGTFSYEAALEYLKRKEGSEPLDQYLREYSSIPLLMEAVRHLDESGLTEAILPVENSIEGQVTPTLDGLTISNGQGAAYYIVDELVLDVVQNLMSFACCPEEVTDVASHPQPFAQTRAFLEKNLAHAHYHITDSTVEAIKKVLDHKRGWAAIGSKAAALYYGIPVINENINDYEQNQTRFIIVGKEISAPTGKDKTSIYFSIRENRPGGLYEVLGEFAKEKINLTKIESRPSKKVLGDYLFFIDLEGHIRDGRIEEVLKKVQEKTDIYRFLGSYPKRS